MAITPLPEAPSTSDPTNFDSEADAFIAALAAFVTEANVLAAAMNAVSAGTACSIPYTFSTTTTDSDPGAGTLRLDNATQNTATTIRADLVGADGSTWTSLIDTFDDSTSTIKGYIMLMKAGDATKWLLFSVSALASPSGYKNISVTIVSSSAANPFANGDSLILKFTRNGDAGSVGSMAFPVSARTSNTILGTGDKATHINVTSGTFTQTLAAAATRGNGWFCFYENSGTGVVTLDGNASETLNGATTMLLAQGESCLIICDGANDRVLKFQLLGDHLVEVHTGNGHGSTNTVIRRFTTTMTNTGSAITYADSATNGGTFTINSPGLYAITYTENSTGSAAAGISVNSAELTTSVSTITAASRKAIAKCGNGEPACCACVLKLVAGDVIRAHTTGAPAGTDARTFFSIRKIGNA